MFFFFFFLRDTDFADRYCHTILFTIKKKKNIQNYIFPGEGSYKIKENFFEFEEFSQKNTLLNFVLSFDFPTGSSSFHFFWPSLSGLICSYCMRLKQKLLRLMTLHWNLLYKICLPFDWSWPWAMSHSVSAVLLIYPRYFEAQWRFTSCYNNSAPFCDPVLWLSTCCSIPFSV